MSDSTETLIRRNFIQVPTVARRGLATTKAVGVSLTELQAPTPDSLIDGSRLRMVIISSTSR